MICGGLVKASYTGQRGNQDSSLQTKSCRLRAPRSPFHPFDCPVGLSNVSVMMLTTDTDPLDSVEPGDPNPTPTDQIPDNGCTFTWMLRTPGGTPYVVACTRVFDHDGRQHVAEGTDDTGVLSVHPWTDTP